MSSFGRMLAVLDLFSEAEPAWTPDAIAQRLACSLPTCYRYVRALSQAGLLRKAAAGSYVLGPRVVELDYQMRQCDPLLRAGHTALQSLCDDTGCDVVVAEMLGDRVITTRQLRGREAVSASFGRGRRMPLFRGMLSKTLLAWLPRARVRRLHAAHPDDAAQAHQAPTLDELLVLLKAIRSDGYCVSIGELDADLVGVAVPLTGTGDVAALGVILSKPRFSTTDLQALVRRLRVAGDEIARSIAQDAG